MIYCGITEQPHSGSSISHSTRCCTNPEQIEFPYLEVLKVLENQVGLQLDIGENREIK